MFEALKAYLTEQGLLLAGGRVVDATINHAPSSTKNQARRRDRAVFGDKGYFNGQIKRQSNNN